MPQGPANTGEPRIFYLDAAAGRILSTNPDDRAAPRVVVANQATPDGLFADTRWGKLYWTNMGDPKVNDGSIMCADLDGRNIETLVAPGGTFTPKQIKLVDEQNKLYWCDREGMRVMRANRDGSVVETLVDSSSGDARPGADAAKWCVGIAVDLEEGYVYWTQKGPSSGGQGQLRRAGIDIPAGETADNRSDIEVLYSGLPEPIDIEFDTANRQLYWTDRGDPPQGNSLNRAPMDGNWPRPEVVMGHFMETIGVAIDGPGQRAFVTDMAGSVYKVQLDGSVKETLLNFQGNLTGIMYCPGQS